MMLLLLLLLLVLLVLLLSLLRSVSSTGENFYHASPYKYMHVHPARQLWGWLILFALENSYYRNVISNCITNSQRRWGGESKLQPPRYALLRRRRRRIIIIIIIISPPTPSGILGHPRSLTTIYMNPSPPPPSPPSIIICQRWNNESTKLAHLSSGYPQVATTVLYYSTSLHPPTMRRRRPKMRCVHQHYYPQPAPTKIYITYIYYIYIYIFYIKYVCAYNYTTYTTTAQLRVHRSRRVIIPQWITSAHHTAAAKYSALCVVHATSIRILPELENESTVAEIVSAWGLWSWSPTAIFQAVLVCTCNGTDDAYVQRRCLSLVDNFVGNS